MHTSKRLIIMAGGTGGHVFPGLSVARFLIKQGWKVRWMGSADRIEANLVPKYGIEIDFIDVSYLRRRRNIKNIFIALIYILKACYQARTVMKRFKPDVVLGMGGYISGPGGIAAWLLGIPIILHEQNSIVGITNKWLAKIAKKVMQAFPGAIQKADVVGNPIRVEILALPDPEVRMIGRKGPIRVLVVGGSQGAWIFNQIMPKVAEKFGKKLTILHQSGRGAQHKVQKAYTDVNQSHHKVIEFIEDIATAYSWADVIICRSGALTVSEISIVGLPALFVPFQHRDHQQYWNALILEKVGAAKIFEQKKFTVDAVVKVFNDWNREILLRMAQRARIAAIPDATERIAKEIICIAKL